MNENIEKFEEFAYNVWNITDKGDKTDIAKLGIQKTREFFRSLGMPETFSDMNINDKKFEEIAADSVSSSDIGNFKTLKKEDVLRILKLST